MALTHTTPQVAALLGTTKRSLARWIETGLVRPRRHVQGPDKWVAVWTDRDVREAQIVARLKEEIGLPERTILPVMEQVRELEDVSGALYLELIAAAGTEGAPLLRVTTQPRNPEQIALPLAS